MLGEEEAQDFLLPAKPRVSIPVGHVGEGSQGGVGLPGVVEEDGLPARLLGLSPGPGFEDGGNRFELAGAGRVKAVESARGH
jgi:hypothetical protein